MKIKGILFDLDGVLLDSMFIWDTIGETYLKEKGISPNDDIREKLRSMSLLQAAEYFRSDYKIKEPAEEIINGINSLVEEFYLHQVKPKPYVADSLHRLKEQNVKMCIVTATDRKLVEGALKRNNLESYFERIFTCTEVGHGKDQADIYLEALKFLSIKKEEVLVFEDALHAILTAKNAGFFVVGVAEDSACDQQPEIKRLSDVYITSFEEMGNFL